MVPPLRQGDGVFPSPVATGEGFGRGLSGDQPPQCLSSIEGCPMTTSADVTAGLHALGITAGDTVFFHSSLKSMGRVTGGPEAVIGGFLEAVGPTGTVVVPTFTLTERLGPFGSWVRPSDDPLDGRPDYRDPAPPARRPAELPPRSLGRRCGAARPHGHCSTAQCLRPPQSVVRCRLCTRQPLRSADALECLVRAARRGVPSPDHHALPGDDLGGCGAPPRQRGRTRGVA